MTTAWQEEPARERIISAAPGAEEYRQIHLAEHNPDEINVFAAPCSTPAHRTRLAGRTEQAGQRVPASRSICAAETGRRG
ncbi:hypothetical protein AQJ46_31450 [Streptomyces canus]|uniref:Uncharacterized protein n=1 Tax=Streptomyces canus TaxID=58343 RepID=A0A101RX19_9ACTN|nr:MULTISPECIES: hypothetical protein [Streptomyces]KUN63306.1 hypothetical protein AQJ46_31450 [Streptomyces canus]MDI5913308.1 hypothetical protein [Streptomyces sp. 12257]